MNISSSTSPDNRMVITLEIQKGDYESRVDAAVKKLRKTANVPGFRKGHVPEGLIRKQYANSIRVDEINNIVREELEAFVRKNSDNVLLSPIPVLQESLDLDAENITLEFETIQKPQVDIDLTNINLDFIDIEIPETEIDELIQKYLKQFAESKAPVACEPTDSNMKFVNLDVDCGDNGVENKQFEVTEFVNPQMLIDLGIEGAGQSKAKDLMVSVKSFDRVGLPETEEEADLKFVVKGFYKHDEAEINQEFFDALFGKDAIDSEAAMKERLAQDMKFSYNNDVRITLFNNAIDQLFSKNEFVFPETVLKSYLKDGEDKEVAGEEVESLKKSLRWELIEMNLKEAHKAYATQEEIKTYMVNRYKSQLGAMGDDERFNEILLGMAEKDLQDKEKFSNARFNIEAEKLTDVFMANCKLSKKTMTPEEFKVYAENQKVAEAV